MDQIRKLLKAARIEQHISLEDLATTLQVTYESLLTFEAGGAIEADVLFGLVNLLNVSPEAVMPYLNDLGWNLASELDIENLVSGRRQSKN